jgi:cytochrome oxidase assembly protein ShyY1
MWTIRKPRMRVLALLVVAQCLFVAAAHWQWQRAQFKDRREREFAAAIASREVGAYTRAGIDALESDFAAARLRGRLLRDRVVLHDNRIVDGQYGVDVYAALALADGHVLVNLGWIAADRSRRQAPRVPELSEDFDASGILAPAPAAGLGADQAIAADARLLHIEPARIAQAFALDAMATRVFWPAPQAGSPFRRDWHPSGMNADRHRGYALQWASFAVASLILFLVLHVRRKEVAP